jgi:hypothetical protein
VIAEGGRDRYGRIVSEEVAIAEGESPFNFSVHVHDRDRMRDRRTIETFFIQEGDRDKMVSRHRQMEGTSPGDARGTFAAWLTWLRGSSRWLPNYRGQRNSGGCAPLS